MKTQRPRDNVVSRSSTKSDGHTNGSTNGVNGSNGNGEVDNPRKKVRHRHSDPYCPSADLRVQ